MMISQDLLNIVKSKHDQGMYVTAIIDQVKQMGYTDEEVSQALNILKIEISPELNYSAETAISSESSDKKTYLITSLSFPLQAISGLCLFYGVFILLAVCVPLLFRINARQIITFDPIWVIWKYILQVLLYSGENAYPFYVSLVRAIGFIIVAVTIRKIKSWTIIIYGVVSLVSFAGYLYTFVHTNITYFYLQPIELANILCTLAIFVFLWINNQFFVTGGTLLNSSLNKRFYLPPFSKKNFLVFLGGIFVIAGVVIGGLYTYKTFIYKPFVPARPISNQISQKVTTSYQSHTMINTTETLYLAYIEQNYSAPDVGTIYLMPATGGNKITLGKVDKHRLMSYSYSPNTKELIITNDNQVLGINIDTGKQRTLYDDIATPQLSFDKNYLMIDQRKGIFINLEDVSKKTALDMPALGEPLYDPVRKTKVIAQGTNGKLKVSPFYKILSGSTLEIKDLKTNMTRTMTFKSTGDAYPLFVANNYLYFIQDFAPSILFAMNSFDKYPLKQLNLSTGEISPPTSLTPLYAQMTDIQKHPDWRHGGGSLSIPWKNWLSSEISPDLTHFIYFGGTGGTDEIQAFDYNLLTNQVRKIPSVSAAMNVTWSSDGEWAILQGKTFHLYNTRTGSVQPISLSISDNYILLQ